MCVGYAATYLHIPLNLVSLDVTLIYPAFSNSFLIFCYKRVVQLIIHTNCWYVDVECNDIQIMKFTIR